MHCPLCSSSEFHLFHQSTKPLKRDYIQCDHCNLVWVPKQFHMPPKIERSEYDLHDNRINDLGYLRFLNKVVPHVCQFFNIEQSFDEHWFQNIAIKHAHTQLASTFATPSSNNITGLDYGCGKAPALAVQLCELGFNMHVFDKFYAPYTKNLKQEYDFVVSTETIEHIFEARETWSLWDTMLKAGGCLVIMTQRVKSRHSFSTWRYIHDPTHICFYSDSTARFIAHKYNLNLTLINQDIMVFTK